MWEDPLSYGYQWEWNLIHFNNIWCVIKDALNVCMERNMHSRFQSSMEKSSDCAHHEKEKWLKFHLNWNRNGRWKLFVSLYVVLALELYTFFFFSKYITNYWHYNQGSIQNLNSDNYIARKSTPNNGKISSCCLACHYVHSPTAI